MDVGFVKGDSTNLPKIDALMVANFFASNPDFCSAEFRNIKTTASARESYGDDAVGYVQLKRGQGLCTVKCKICPEHKVRIKPYSATVVVDENKELVTSAQCHDCAASEGGCKHAVAFLMWLHRRSEEPSCTSLECYWKQSSLAKVGSSIKILTTRDLGKLDDSALQPNTSVYQDFINECKRRKIDSVQYLRHEPDYESEINELSLHDLMCRYNRSNDCDTFLIAIKNMFNDKNIEKAERLTRDQSKSSIWYELRYGRVTASKCYEVSKCKTSDGSLVATILGARTPETPAIKRGKLLEEKVRKAVEKKLGQAIRPCGLYISNKYPMVAGSPDGLCNNTTLLEIKCPFKQSTVENYIKNGAITSRCNAQVQMQMFCANMQKTYFCVANTNFEVNGLVHILEVNYDHTYTTKLLDDVVLYWKNNIFPILCESSKI